MKVIITGLILLLSFSAFAEEQLELFPEIQKSKENQKLMYQFVEEMGEYFDESAEFEDLDLKVVYIKEAEIPEKLLEIANSDLQDYGYDNASYENSPFLTDFYQVVKISTGELVGYAFGIHDDIDHPLWDGSGATNYYTFDYIFIDSVDWAG